jgi:hypothetical protein
VNDEAAKSPHILVDPYIPYARIYHDKQVQMAWLLLLDSIRPGETSMIALKKAHYLTHFDKDEGGTGQIILHIKDLEPTRKFFRLFKNHNETTDPFGQKWVKIHENACGFEVWKRVAT